MRYLTLHKIGFLLDDFAQLQANRNVPNMFKVGWSKLRYWVGRLSARMYLKVAMS